MGGLISSFGSSIAEGAASSAAGSAMRTTTHGKKGSRQLAISTSTFQFAAVGFFGVLLGLLFYFIFKKQTDFSMPDAFMKIMLSLIMLFLVVVIAQSYKLNSLDFILSSEINVLCMYLLLCYIGFTYASFSSPLENLFTFTSDLFSVLSDPTYIYTKGFSLLLPIILFVIPILVLLYDATKSLAIAFVTLGISIAIVYFLYPSADIVPITGGSSAGVLGSSQDCVSSYSGYINPFNWGKSKC